jgi:hypothetical protein
LIAAIFRVFNGAGPIGVFGAAGGTALFTYPFTKLLQSGNPRPFAFRQGRRTWKADALAMLWATEAIVAAAVWPVEPGGESQLEDALIAFVIVPLLIAGLGAAGRWLGLFDRQASTDPCKACGWATTRKDRYCQACGSETGHG